MAVPASNPRSGDDGHFAEQEAATVASASAADARDLIYVPPTRDLPASVLPDPALVTILDQADTAASVGFALAAVLNYLRAERGIRDRVSPFFLYDNARRLDEWGGSPHDGSTLRGGLKGLRQYGAALERDVPPPRLPRKSGDTGWLVPAPDALLPDVVQRALANRPASYERVEPNIEHLKAAVADQHAVLVAATISLLDGWSNVKKGEIPVRRAAGARSGASVAGHAFAVIGYTERGFIVQNSWGASWGGLAIGDRTLPGCATWPYAEAAQSLQEAWVVRLVPEAAALARVLAGYAADSVGGPDLLEVRRDAQAFSLVLASREVEPPLAIGLFGDWGGGKSFFMRLMQDEIDGAVERAKSAQQTSPFLTNVVPIRFNAWHYLDADLWASLVTEIFDRLFERIAPKADLAPGLRTKLHEAQGLFMQARLQLDEATEAREHANTALKNAIEERERQEKSLATQLDDVASLLAGDADLQERIGALSTALGVDELKTSYAALSARAQDLKTLGGRISVLLESTVGSPAGYLRLVALGAVLLLPVALAYAVEWLQSRHGAQISDARSLAIQVSTLFAGVTAWLGVQLKQGRDFLATLEEANRKLEDRRKKRLETDTAEQAHALQAAREREEAARTALREAELRVQTIERELAEQKPGRLLYRFIEERAKSSEYRSRLGIVSLVRRDFEQLSNLFEQGRNDAEVRKLMPVERIILYIDDLDRCKPDRVIEVLEAVHLLLAFKLFMVVVAVDPRWLRRCLEKHYPELLTLRSEQASLLGNVLPSRPATAQDYLEKIFQVPFTLQPLGHEGYRNLMRGLVASKATGGPSPTAPTATEPPPSAGAAGASAELRAATQQPAAQAPFAVDTAPAPPPAPVAPPSDAESIERLVLSEWEQRDLERLSALFRAPRAVKRFLNTYRFLRASLLPTERDSFVGSVDHPGEYRVVLVLLSVVVSFSNIAPLFLQRLLDYDRDGKGHRTWRAFIESVQLKDVPPRRTGRAGTRAVGAKSASAQGRQSDTNLNESALPSWEEAEWRHLCLALAELSGGRDENGKLFPPTEFDCYVRWTPRVARYSYSLSALLTMRR